MTDSYAVFGNPIAQSKSPAIHRHFCEQTGEDMTYTKQLVPEGEFKKAADAFFVEGGRGLNITSPFKLDAFDYADRRTPRAERAGAVNLLIKEHDGSITGDTSDGVGMVNDMLNMGWELSGKKLLILGAGGAVRGVLEPLLGQQPESLTIANRTVSKAEALAKDFHDLGCLKSCSFDELAGKKFDVVINGTSAGLHGEMVNSPTAILNRDAACYDTTSAADPTAFLLWAEQQGAE